ncbi:hypothetical protein N8I77_009519 [Diaporthe amygdali]|uniref:Uncharacterized protein n=1 Tax=Phomopsis amygdali TaxID=1214568 RepID=A0AAD9W2J6_PHOAM|nr:hypothetical protein N8I77_009519 [Diaporthe amygdali]
MLSDSHLPAALTIVATSEAEHSSARSPSHSKAASASVPSHSQSLKTPLLFDSRLGPDLKSRTKLPHCYKAPASAAASRKRMPHPEVRAVMQAHNSQREQEHPPKTRAPHQTGPLFQQEAVVGGRTGDGKYYRATWLDSLSGDATVQVP